MVLTLTMAPCLECQEWRTVKEWQGQYHAAELVCGHVWKKEEEEEK